MASRLLLLTLITQSAVAHATNLFYRPVEGTLGTVLWYLTDEQTGQCKSKNQWHDIQISPNPRKLEMGCWRLDPEDDTFALYGPRDKKERDVPVSDFRPVPGTSRQLRKLIQLYCANQPSSCLDTFSEREEAWRKARPHP